MNRPRTALDLALSDMEGEIDFDAGLLAGALPEGCVFTDDTWDVGTWSPRVDRARVQTLDFGAIAHEQLRAAAKVLVLRKRALRRTGVSPAYGLIKAATALGSILQARLIQDMTFADAHAAEQRLAEVGVSYLSSLAALIRELRRIYGIAVVYAAAKTAGVRHGNKGTDEGRAAKRIPDDVLMKLLNLISRDDLPDFDQLFVSALALNTACGWRIGELVCLPQDCLLEDETGLFVRGYPSKGGKIAPKLVAPPFAPMVREAHARIVRLTEPGREIARQWAQSADPVWREVVKDKTAVLHFARILLHRWAREPDHRLINPDAAWHRDRGWIDVLGAIDSHPSERQAHLALNLHWGTFQDLKRQQMAAREGRIWTRQTKPTLKSWLRDGRVCDKFTLFQMMGFATGQKHHDDAIDALVLEAVEHQLSGSAIPMPSPQPDLERRYARSRSVLLRDGTTARVHVDEALFVVPKYFIGRMKSKADDWQAVTPEHFMHWLGGTPTTPSVFERHDILDPATGQTARFTSHQIRHWLETQMHRGGLNDSQLAGLMNRKAENGGSVYNQMSNAERRAFVAEGIHDGVIGGAVVDAVNRSEVTEAEAKDILEARLRQINMMPHGLCLKDLATEPCPHHMACFSAGSPDQGQHGACVHLLVDLREPGQRAAIESERDKANAMVEMLEDDPELDDSPQIEHFATIARTTSALLAGEEDT